MQSANAQLQKCSKRFWRKIVESHFQVMKYLSLWACKPPAQRVVEPWMRVNNQLSTKIQAEGKKNQHISCVSKVMIERDFKSLVSGEPLFFCVDTRSISCVTFPINMKLGCPFIIHCDREIQDGFTHKLYIWCENKKNVLYLLSALSKNAVEYNK